MCALYAYDVCVADCVSQPQKGEPCIQHILQEATLVRSQNMTAGVVSRIMYAYYVCVLRMR